MESKFDEWKKEIKDDKTILPVIPIVSLYYEGAAVAQLRLGWEEDNYFYHHNFHYNHYYGKSVRN